MTRNPLPGGLAPVLAFLLFTGACSTSPAKQPWTTVRAPEEIRGRWENTVAVEIPRDAMNGIPGFSLVVSMTIEYALGTEKVDTTVKVDFGQFLDVISELAATQGLLDQGLTKDELWEGFVSQYGDGGEISTGKYYISTTQTESPGEAVHTSDLGEIQINADRSRLRLLFSQPLSFGMGDPGITEFTLDRVQ